jgi:hypothetical protein
MRTTLVHNYLHLLMIDIVVIAYDTLLTLPDEIELVWKGEMGLVSLFYFMARYPNLVFFLGAMVMNNDPEPSLQVHILSPMTLNTFS